MTDQTLNNESWLGHCQPLLRVFYPKDDILQAVPGYHAYALRCCVIEEHLAERGIAVDRATFY